LASKIDVPIVNAGDGTHEHPTQALLDTFSLRESLGQDLTGKNIAIVGDIQHSRVALSNLLALQRLGANVRVCGPETLVPRHLRELGVEVSHDLDETVQWADALNMLRIQMERQGPDDAVRFFPSLREYTMRFGLTMERLEQASRPLTIMHPGPINRGVEITSEVADSEHAIILDQVENGVAVRMAVLYLLAQRRG
jgi:aspartate carbamoyltransferase catalytic subunit